MVGRSSRCTATWSAVVPSGSAASTGTRFCTSALTAAVSPALTASVSDTDAALAEATDAASQATAASGASLVSWSRSSTPTPRAFRDAWSPCCLPASRRAHRILSSSVSSRFVTAYRAGTPGVCRPCMPPPNTASGKSMCACRFGLLRPAPYRKSEWSSSVPSPSAVERELLQEPREQLGLIDVHPRSSVPAVRACRRGARARGDPR